MQWGLALHNLKVPAVPEVSRMLSGLCCGLENPQVLLFQAATSLSFRFLVVMPFAAFTGITFGESPELCLGFISMFDRM